LKALEQHQVEIQRNKESRAAKPLIRKIYADFYDRIVRELARDVPGKIVEIGSGSGDLKARVPEAICTDLFPNPWLDLVADAYRLPFGEGTVSNLILLDVFHHLVRPYAFLREAERVLAAGGRVILFEPYISFVSSIAYGWFHHEPVAWKDTIDLSEEAPTEQQYYAAQGNATRVFFAENIKLPKTLYLEKAQATADFAYLLSGGLSKPALYPMFCYPVVKVMDKLLSIGPKIFGGRCLIVLKRSMG
jgi:SAM-dependent methyltransferase